MSHWDVSSTGVKIKSPTEEILDKRLEQHDKPGEHLWVCTGAWIISDPRAKDIQLDIENLVSIAGPGCFKCEQPFSNRLARRPCHGSMELQ
jgi:hypothetical protein